MSIKNIWNNRKDILEGLKNNVFKKEDVEVIYEERLNICKGCEHYDIKGTDCAVPGTNPCCGHCGCSIGLKLRCLSCSCPIKKWDKLLTQTDVTKNFDKLNNEV